MLEYNSKEAARLIERWTSMYHIQTATSSSEQQGKNSNVVCL